MDRIGSICEKQWQQIVSRNYADQCKYMLNGFWDKLEKDAEHIYNWCQKISQYDDHKDDGTGLNEVQSVEFLKSEGLNPSLFSVIDVDCNKKMTIVEFIMFKYDLPVLSVLSAFPRDFTATHDNYYGRPGDQWWILHSCPERPAEGVPQNIVPYEVKQLIDQEVQYLEDHPDEVEDLEYYNLVNLGKAVKAHTKEYFEKRIEDVLNVVEAELDFFQKNPELIEHDEYEALFLLLCKYKEHKRRFDLQYSKSLE